MVSSTDHTSHYVVFSTPPLTSYSLGPNIILSTLFSNTLSLPSSLNVSDHVSHPYTIEKIIVLYILILIFLIANWKTKDSAPNNGKHSLTSNGS